MLSSFTDFFLRGISRSIKARFDIKWTFFQNVNGKPWILQVTQSSWSLMVPIHSSQANLLFVVKMPLELLK